jgi:hypothetical protein
LPTVTLSGHQLRFDGISVTSNHSSESDLDGFLGVFAVDAKEEESTVDCGNSDWYCNFEDRCVDGGYPCQNSSFAEWNFPNHSSVEEMLLDELNFVVTDLVLAVDCDKSGEIKLYPKSKDCHRVTVVRDGFFRIKVDDVEVMVKDLESVADESLGVALRRREYSPTTDLYLFFMGNYRKVATLEVTEWTKVEVSGFYHILGAMATGSTMGSTPTMAVVAGVLLFLALSLFSCCLVWMLSKRTAPETQKSATETDPSHPKNPEHEYELVDGADYHYYTPHVVRS